MGTRHERERKKIQPSATIWNVITVPAQAGRAGQAAGRARCHSRSATSTPPCSAPQITKFQLAPCHSPPSTIVPNSAKQVRHSAWREPPKAPM